MSDPSIRSRRLLLAAGALVIWVLTLFFGWAIQPIDDTVPVEVDPDSALAVELARDPSATPPDAPRAQLVVCNSLLASEPRDRAEPLPALRDDYVYARPPCVAPHEGARLAAAANVLAVIAIVAGGLWIIRRLELDQPPVDEKSPAVQR